MYNIISSSSGVTPLHDACINGHLEVIRYLLDRGASVIAKTDAGETPLHFLKQWRKSVESLTPEAIELYNSIVGRMNGTLERFGQKIEKQYVLNTNSVYQDDEKEKGLEQLIVGTRRDRRRSQMSNATPSPSPRKKDRSPRKIGEARRKICDEDDDDDDKNEKNKGIEEVSARNEYKQVMENLRHRTNTLTIEKKRKSDDELKKPTHVQNDDWLEDDLGITSTVKRRKSSISSCSSSSNIFHTSNTRKSTDLDSHIEISSNASSGDEEFIQKPKRKKQISLIKAGFSRFKTSPSQSPKKIASPVKKLIEADSLSSAEQKNHQNQGLQQMLSVDVRIEDKLYRVPIPASETNCLTIKWLAEEAAKRYFK